MKWMADDHPQNTGEPKPSGDEYLVAPPDPDTPRYKPPLYQTLPDEFPEPEPETKEPLQFTLRELMLTVTVAAVVLGLVCSLPGGWSVQGLAFVAGLGVLAGLVVLQWLQPKRRIIYFVWWILFISYLVMCLAAGAATF
jgi:hypothetical protein